MITTTSDVVTVEKIITASTIGTLPYDSVVPAQETYAIDTLRIEVSNSTGISYSIATPTLVLLDAVAEEGSWDVDTRLWVQTVAPVDGLISADYTVSDDGLYRVRLISDSSADADVDGNIITTLGSGAFNKITSVDTLII